MKSVNHARVHVSLFETPRHSSLLHKNDYNIGNSKPLNEPFYGLIQTPFASLLYSNELVIHCKRQKEKKKPYML